MEIVLGLVETLLDGGSAFSLATEEALVSWLHRAVANGMGSSHPEWPLAGLQHWGHDSATKTVSAGPPVMVRAIALLRVVVLGLDGSRVTKVFRVRIL